MSSGIIKIKQTRKIQKNRIKFFLDITNKSSQAVCLYHLGPKIFYLFLNIFERLNSNPHIDNLSAHDI